MTTEYYRGYAAGINRCRKPALMLVDAAEKQMKEMEAKLAKAVEALNEALHFLQPDERDVSKEAGIIGVESVKEHEDGSADYVFHFDAHARGLLAEEGLKLVLYCAAAKLDMGLVYDWIESQMEKDDDEAT